MQPAKSCESGRAGIQDNATDTQAAKERAAVEGDVTPKAPDSLVTAIGFMEEYAEVFGELAK